MSYEREGIAHKQDSRAHSFSHGRYDGRTLREWLPDVVAEVVATVDPVEVILFGSVARGEEGPDSDIDLLVVLDKVERSDKGSLMTTIYRGIRSVIVPVDVLVTDPTEIARDRDRLGSILYWPLREGRSVYHRPHPNVG